MAQPKPFDRMRGDDYRPLHTDGDDYRPLHTDEAPVLNPVESRQGVISGRVLMILTASLLLAGVAAAILYAWAWT